MIDFEHSMRSKLVDAAIIISPFDSEEIYEETCARIRQDLGDYSSFIDKIKALALEAGMSLDDIAVVDQLKNVTDFGSDLMKILLNSKEEFRESIKDEYGEMFSVLAYQDVIHDYYSSAGLPNIFEDGKNYDVMFKLREFMAHKSIYPQENVLDYMEQNGIIKKEGSHWVVIALGVTIEDLWLGLSRLQKPEDILKSNTVYKE